jgi:hypothetical protein
LRAARMRRRRLVFSGSRRIVMLATTPMIALIALMAKHTNSSGHQAGSYGSSGLEHDSPLNSLQ